MFVTLPEPVIAGLEAEGAGFHRWPESSPTSPTIRLVCAHDTTEADVEALLAATRRLLGS